MPPSRADRGRRLAPDERRAQLVEIAAGLFGARPYPELGVADVARAARITQGLVYHYFPTKTAVFAAAFEHLSRRLLAASLPEGGALPEKARAGVRGYLDFAEENRVAFLNLFRGATLLEPDFLRIADATRATIVERTLATLGLARRKAAATRLALRGYLGAAESVTLEWLAEHALSRPAIERLLLGALLTAIVSGLREDGLAPAALGSLELFERAFRDALAL